MTVTAFSRVRAAAYLLLLVAGVVLPYRVFAVGVEHSWTWALLCAWLIAGGTLAAAGQLSGTYLGEYVGQPLIVSALAGFGVLQLVIAGPAAIPAVAILWSFALLVAARWRDVVRVFRASRKAAQ